jgi:PAS domain S-box-containing protein
LTDGASEATLVALGAPWGAAVKKNNIQGRDVTRTFGLRAALMVLVLIAMAPVFVLVVQAALSEQRGRLQRAEANLGGLVELGAAQQERLIEGARLMLSAMAHSPPIYGDDLVACAAYLRKLQQQFPSAYGTFGLLDTQGRLTCRSAPSDSSVRSSDRSFFRAASDTGRFSVGEFTVSRANGRNVLPLGLPVYREDSTQLRGVAYVALDLDQMGEQLRRLAIAPEVTLVVTDGSGAVLGSAGPRAPAVGSTVPPGYFQQALAAGEARMGQTTDADGTQWLFGLRPVGRAGEGKLFVAGMAARDEVLASWAQRLQLQLGALALITLAVVALAWLFADRVVVRPMQGLLRRVDAMAQEEQRLDQPPPRTVLREFRELSGAVHLMARRLLERAVQRDGAMSEMAHQKNLLESVLESMSEGVLVLDGQGRFVHINGAARRILPGLPAFARRGHVGLASAHDWGLFSADGGTPLPDDERPSAKALQGATVESFRLMVRGPLSAGRETIMQGSARPIVMPDGTPSGAAVVFSDHTEAHRAEEALRASEQRYRTLFEANPHPMWVFDAETLAFLTVNDAAVARYGYSREEFLAMTITDIRPPEDVPALRQSVGRLAGPISTPRHWRHRLKDGRIIRVEVTSHELVYEGRRPGWCWRTTSRRGWRPRRRCATLNEDRWSGACSTARGRWRWPTRSWSRSPTRSRTTCARRCR